MKISLAQIEVGEAQVAVNLKKISEWAAQAKALGSSLICLPELATSGFNWEKNRAILRDTAAATHSIAALARAHRIAICGSFLEATTGGGMANTMHYFASDGQLLGTYRKIHLFKLFAEERFVEPGDCVKVIETAEGKVGFGICYDLRFPELFRKNAELGAVLQILPAAFPHPRLDHWQTLVRARAIENQCFFAAVNQVGPAGPGGGSADIRFFGHSMLVDPWGRVLAEGGEAEELLTVDLDFAEVATVRSRLTAWGDRRPDLF